TGWRPEPKDTAPKGGSEMNGSRHWIALLSAVGVVAFAACEAQEEPAEEPAMEEPAAAEDEDLQIAPEDLPEGVTVEMVQQGEELFTGNGNCYTCHGQDAMGTQLAPDLTDDEWINVEGDYESIIQVVTEGVAQPVEHPSPMPPMGGVQLSDEQVRAVSAYVYAISRGDG
ncbi:MAG: c-type cytochrome, partial [Gemmatimonadota bacterium]